MRNSSHKASSRVPSPLLRDDNEHIPLYRRASTGSCHDLCKYNIKHEHEHKKLNPTFRRSLMIKEKHSEKRKKVIIMNPRKSWKKTDYKQGKAEIVQPPEKVAIASSIHLMNEIDQDSHMCSSSLDQSSTNKIDELSEEITFKNSKGGLSEGLISKPAHSILDCKEVTAETHEDGYILVRHNANFAVSLPVEQNIASSRHIVKIKETSDPQVSTELLTESSVKKNLSNDPHTEVGVAEASSKELVGGRLKLPKVTAVKPMSVKLKNNKNTTFLKGSAFKQADKTASECSGIKLKTPLSTHISTLNVKAPTIRTEESSGEQCHQKSLTTNHKIKREANKLTVANKETRFSDKAKFSTPEKMVVAGGPSSVNKRVSEKKTTKPSFDKIALEAPKFIIKKTAITPKKTNAYILPSIKKQTSVSPKTTDASVKLVTSMKPKRIMVSSSSSTPSELLIGQRNKMEIVDNEDKQMVSVPQSSKSRLNKVPCFKQIKLGNVIPVTEQYPANANNYGPRKKSSSNTDKKTENTDLKAARENLRKLRLLYSFDQNDCHENYVSNWNQVKKYTLRKEGTVRNFGIVIKGEIKKRNRRTSSIQLLDKSLTPHKLNFSRGTVINPEPRSNTFVKLKFRPPTSIQSRQNLFASTSSGPNSQKSEAQTIVLRHQDLQDKQVALGLLNDVIEETASKLVKTKKSKVKALVSAFETVISLQASKCPVAIKH